MLTRAKSFYDRNRRWTPIVFFIAGFIFDALMLRRVDELLTIIQQAVYILISAGLIRLELIETQRELTAHPWLKRVWHYREDALHFLMGTLLNAYTIFFFKSASALTGLAFIVILVALLIVNEFGHFGKSQTKVHVAILSLCLISYLVTLMPIILGFMGILPFALAMVAAVVVFLIFQSWVQPILTTDLKILRSHLQFPFAAIFIIYALLYISGAIPPVPLSVRFMGIYHNIEKSNGEYNLQFNRPLEYFWQHGDQTFFAKPGDQIYCFARIFSPTRFKDELFVHWFFADSKVGWQSRDRIGITVTGGREEGFRGFTKKSNYEPGKWRVQIETRDGREVGRLNFTVEADDGTAPREIHSEID